MHRVPVNQPADDDRVGGPRRVRSRHGQALVETALLLPLLLILLLGAVDFGRIFFGWVAVTNASRVAANYAATHPDAWALGNTSQQQEYRDLVRNAGVDNCGLADPANPVPPPTFPDLTRELGDRVRVDLECEFQLVNPFAWASSLFSSPLHGSFTIAASSTFNIRQGCTGCVAAPAGPPPPSQNHCRLLPNMVNLSVAGARLAWTAAGFTGAFTPLDAEDTRTVSSRTVDQGGNEGCSGSYAFFSSSVFVTLAPIASDGPDCEIVPNVLGMTVASARSAWSTAGFDPAVFEPPTGDDERIVSSVTFGPDGVARGQCREPAEVTLIRVESVAPPPAPVPPPCRVPSFVNTPRADAQGTWDDADFSTLIRFQPPASNWTMVGRQSLVGGSYAACSSEITLRP